VRIWSAWLGLQHEGDLGSLCLPPIGQPESCLLTQCLSRHDLGTRGRSPQVSKDFDSSAAAACRPVVISGRLSVVQF